MSTITQNYSKLDQLLDLLVQERWEYRRCFFRNYDVGPWTCVACGLAVDISELNVHHKDEDRKNNSIENLEPMHKSCHQRHHSLRNDMTVVLQARWSSPGAGEQYAQTMQERGYRVPCGTCGKEIVHWHMERHIRTHGG